jgi:hypothetical protein
MKRLLLALLLPLSALAGTGQTGPTTLSPELNLFATGQALPECSSISFPISAPLPSGTVDLTINGYDFDNAGEATVAVNGGAPQTIPTTAICDSTYCDKTVTGMTGFVGSNTLQFCHTNVAGSGSGFRVKVLTATYATASGGSMAVNLSAAATSVVSGGSTTLSWTTTPPASVGGCTKGGGWSGTGNSTGGPTSTGALTATTTYTLACTDGTNTGTGSVTVAVTTNQLGLVPGVWKVISGSGENMQKYNPCPGCTGGVDGNEGATAIVNDWGSAAFADNVGTNGTLIVWGGGHNGYGGNEVYQFDLATGIWSRNTRSAVTFSGPTSSCNTAVVEYADGNPCPGHDYDSLQYWPSGRSLVVLGTADPFNWGGVVGGSNTVHKFNIQTKVWTRAGAFTSFADSDEGPATGYDAARDVFWHASNNAPGHFSKYDPNTETVTDYQTNNWNGAQVGTVVKTSTVDAFVVHHGVRTGNVTVFSILAYDLTSPASVPVTITTTGNSGPVMNESAPGFEWDSADGVIVAWAGGGTVYTLTPPATNWKTNPWVWTAVAPVSGGNPPGGTLVNHTYGRWRYVPNLNAFILVNGTGSGNVPDGNVYAYKLSASSGGGPTPIVINITPSASTVTQGANVSLTWTTSPAATSCTASGDPLWTGTKAGSGTEVVGPLTSTPSQSFTLNCSDNSGNVGTGSATVAVTAPSGSDFATRCAAPGVLKCIGFDVVGDFTHDTAGGYLNAASSGTYRCVQDSVIKAGGASSLHCVVDDTEGYSLSGGYDVPMGQGFGQNSDFYVQYRMRVDSNMLNGVYREADNTQTTWKQSNFHRAGSTCGNIELTTVNQTGKSFPKMYTQCGSGPYFNIGVNHNGDNGDQSSLNDAEYDCRYSAQSAGNFSKCYRYTADQWATYYYHIHIGTWGNNDSNILAWVAPDGQPMKQWEYVIGKRLDFDVTPADVYDKVLLTGGYMSFHTPHGLPPANMWYDELIISTQPIAAPANNGGGTNTVTASISSTDGAGNAKTNYLTTDHVYLTWACGGTATGATASNDWTGTQVLSNSNVDQGTHVSARQYIYTITCADATFTNSANVTVTVTAPTAPTLTFTASATNILSNAHPTVSWSTTNASSCTASGHFTFSGSVAISNTNVSVGNFPNGTRTLTLTCTGAGGSITKTIDFIVAKTITASLTVLPSPVVNIGSVTATFSSTNAEVCVGYGGNIGTWATLKSVNGTYTEQVSGLTEGVANFSFYCGNGTLGESTSVSQNVTVLSSTPAPLASLSTMSTRFSVGETIEIALTTQYASSCIAVGVWPVQSPYLGNLNGSYLFTAAEGTYVPGVRCVGAGGSVTVYGPTLTVTVTPLVLNYFTASPATISSGQYTTLNWSVTGPIGSTCLGSVSPTAPQDAGWTAVDVGLSGTHQTPVMTNSGSFGLNCTAPGQSQSLQAAVNVVLTPPLATLTSNTYLVTPGNAATLTYKCEFGNQALWFNDYGFGTPVADGASHGGISTGNLSAGVYTYGFVCANTDTGVIDAKSITIQSTSTTHPRVHPRWLFPWGF